MFTGKYENTTDTKFRMIIPAKFREELGYKCVITKGIDHCLYIYPEAQWEEFELKLKELPLSNIKARAFVRYFHESAVKCEMDKQGRVTLPQEHREYASIEKELVTIGIMDKIEVWGKEAYESDPANVEPDPEELAKAMEAYGI